MYGFKVLGYSGSPFLYTRITPRGYGLFDDSSVSTSPRICSLRSSEDHTHIKLQQPKLTLFNYHKATIITQDRFLIVKILHKRIITVQKIHKVECSGRRNINNSTGRSSRKPAFLLSKQKMLKIWLDGGLDQRIRVDWRGWCCRMCVELDGLLGSWWVVYINRLCFYMKDSKICYIQYHLYHSGQNGICYLIMVR